MRILLILVPLLALILPTSVAAGELSCSWRAAAEEGSADNPTGDTGARWVAGSRLTEAAWRGLDEHFQQHHFGLWTAEEVAALEGSPGVALAVLHPLPDRLTADGRMVRPDEAGVVQWPSRVAPTDVILVAVANARPGEDWVMYPVEPVPGQVAAVAPLLGPASAAVDPGASGFYRVHRLVADAQRWPELRWTARRVDVNPFELESGLELTTGQVALEISSGATSPQVLASGTFWVRSRSHETIEAPALVNLSLHGPGSDLFTIQVLPAGGEPAASSARNARVSDRLDFLVMAPASTLAGSAFIDQLLPPGRSLELSVAAEIVSFVNEPGEELDMGLSSAGFSVAPGLAVSFPPSSLLPRELVQRRAWLELWRPEQAAPGSE
jgi:hypothetical protein